jgi:predicted secreted protein
MLGGLPPATQQARDAFLAARLPSYPAYLLLNRSKNTDYVLYALYDENMRYFAEGTVKGDWFGPARYSDMEASMGDGRRLYDQLQQEGAGYFLVAERGRTVQLPTDDFFRQHFEETYAIPGVRLFQLKGVDTGARDVEGIFAIRGRAGDATPLRVGSRRGGAAPAPQG